MQRSLLAARSAFGALADPTRQDLVAALGELTGHRALAAMRDRMLGDAVGRRILRERPLISSVSLDLGRLRGLEKGSFGRTYADFLEAHDVSPDTRTEVKHIDDPELGYVMTRYRQVHDFWHTLTGLGVSVEEELALKWLELVQAGMPVALLSSLFGPVRLSAEERRRLFDKLVPWAHVGAAVGGCKEGVGLYTVAEIK
ncbi:Ubiquinone biosynthesis protein [Irineochytrium annulatum]|nr:Ubiquinone biosynthesis protein [Irineochytrium annulatum]